MLPYVMFTTWLSKFDREDEGQGLVEYALIIVLVSIVCIIALRALGVRVNAIFEEITAGLS